MLIIQPPLPITLSLSKGRLPSTGFLRQASFDKLPSTSSGRTGGCMDALTGVFEHPDYSTPLPITLSLSKGRIPSTEIGRAHV